MNEVWVGAVSALAGAITATFLQMWYEQLVYRRQSAARWDQNLLTGIVEYLTAADRAQRSMLRWRHIRIESGAADLDESGRDALSLFEEVHEKSQLIALLGGRRDDAIREAARQMREPLQSLRDEIVGNALLTDERTNEAIARHRDARTRLIAAAQHRLVVRSR